MIAIPQALLPLVEALAYRDRWGVNRDSPLLPHRLPQRTEYALRRIGGLRYLEARRMEFLQAYNEAPFEDSDEDTVLQPDEEMKRMSDGGVQRVKR